MSNMCSAIFYGGLTNMNMSQLETSVATMYIVYRLELCGLPQLLLLRILKIN